MATIIVSYRRADGDAIAGRIRDRLANSFGDDSVYMDIDSIPFGLDFREHIKKALLQTEILVAVIGPNWIGQREDGTRISDETDPVRIEVETALQRNIPVIPVLVGGASMPKPSELPDGLKDLAFRNAAAVDGGRDFHQHMDRLIRSIEKLIAEASDSSHEPQKLARKPEAPKPTTHTHNQILPSGWVTISLAVGLTAALGAVGYLLIRQQPSMPQLSAAAPLQQSSSSPAQQPQVQNVATTSEILPKVPPPCNRSNLNGALFDNFKTEQIGWTPSVGTNILGADGKVAFYGGGGLVFEVPLTKTFTELYTPLIFSAVNVCVHIKNPTELPSGEVLAGAGIVFWSQNSINGDGNYNVSIFLQPPSAQVYRNLNGNWAGAGIATSSLVKTQPSATNQLQILTKGEYGAYYVNGSKLGEFKGQPPNKSFAGLIAQSGAKQKLQWTFLDFSVIENN
jgi:hypothetical protein